MEHFLDDKMKDGWVSGTSLDTPEHLTFFFAFLSALITKMVPFWVPRGAWGTILTSFLGSGAPPGGTKGTHRCLYGLRDVPLAPCRVPGELQEGPWGALGELLGGSLAHFAPFWTYF